MASHTIKADIALNFHGWVDENDKPVLDLVGTDEELNLSTVFSGKVDVSAGKLYEVLREQKENGRRPLFVLTILDDEPVKIPGMKNEDPDQEKLDLGQPKPPIDMEKPKPMTPEQEKIIAEEQNVKADAESDEHQKNLLTKPRNVH